MRSSTIFAVAVALLCSSVTVVAQTSLPTCAATCFSSALFNQTTCLPTDTACICASEPLNMAIQGCVMATCTLKEALSTVNTTNTMCGIPIRDRSSQLIITNAVFGALALFALGIRMMVSLQQHIFGYDDFCTVVAYIFAAPVTFGQLVCGLLGFGKDTWAVPAKNIYLIMKIVYFNQLSYFLSSTASKLCFLFMFLRIFPGARTRRFVYAGMVLSILFPIAFGLPMTFACRPISAAWTSWDAETPYSYCINQTIFWFVAAGYNIFVDVYILVIPLPELLKLNLSMRKKLMLLAMFSTGAITILVSISRLWALAQYNASTNPIYDNMLSGIFSPLELNVGIVAMCMPAFRRFIACFLPSWFGSSVAASSGQKYRYQVDDGGDGTPKRGRGSSSAVRRKKMDSLGGSLFRSTVVGAGDAGVEDEVGLVEVVRGVEESREEIGLDGTCKTHHQETIVKN